MGMDSSIGVACKNNNRAILRSHPRLKAAERSEVTLGGVVLVARRARAWTGGKIVSKKSSSDG